MAKQRFTVADAAALLETTPDAVRMRIQRGKLDSVKEDGRVYILLDPDETKSKHEGNVESSALISAKDETIELLRAQLEAERTAHAEARRLLMAALERIPPQLEAPGSSEALESDLRASETPDRGAGREPDRSDSGGSERPGFWSRLFKGGA